ncbi:hypothetical protein ACFOPX_04545 [Helicobacter baculiformis]|uniref:Sialidase A n=1 Tax=Helicobacter baculiformis TaxID=427351 RepID=A0ABV7ZGY0_9HELI
MIDEQIKLEELDRNLAILREKGVKEIAQATKIANPKLEAILEKRFEDLQRVRAVGFIQILEKEYGLNLSHWLVEYDKTLFMKAPLVENETNNTTTELPFVDTKRTDPEVLVTSFKSKKTSKWAWLVPLVLLVGVGAYIYHSRYAPSQEDQNTPPIPSPQESIPPAPQTPTTPPSPAPQTSSQTTPQSSSTPTIQDALTLLGQSKTLEKPAETLEKSASVPEKSTEIPVDKSNVVVITPKEEMWMESVDLNTKKKTQIALKEPFILETKGHKWLLAFGHGNVSLEANGKTLNFEQKKPLRLLYTPKNGLRRVSYARYQEWSR